MAEEFKREKKNAATGQNRSNFDIPFGHSPFLSS